MPKQNAMNHRVSVLSVCGVLFLLSGCLGGNATTGTASRGTTLPDRYSLPKVGAERVEPPEGTIYREGSIDLYRDSRASRVGDIVLVNVVETSSGSKKASTKTERDSSLTGGVTSFFGVEQWLSEKNQRYTPSATNVQSEFKNEFDGSGETKRDSTVTATLSARVVEATMDGNLVIRGYREVRVNNETQHIILSGVIRPEDISFDNTILSTHIADARIEYSGTGAIADKQQPGWLARGLDVIWPF